MSDIPTLYHKSRDNPVESTALVMQILATLSFSFFSGAESTEILWGDRGILEKLNY